MQALCDTLAIPGGVLRKLWESPEWEGILCNLWRTLYRKCSAGCKICYFKPLETKDEQMEKNALKRFRCSIRLNR